MATISTIDAVRFLNQATFGASEQSIAELQAIGSCDLWIQQQLDLPASLSRPYTADDTSNYEPRRHDIWWKNVIEGQDQLRQRLAFAWSQIMVINDHDYELGLAQIPLAGYYDMLAEFATGNFRELLERVTLHPLMGIFLSMLRNERADPERNVRPDENYAREVLQLFTIGLYELDANGQPRNDDNGPIPSYDQETVQQFAKVFTGWNLADAGEVWVSNDLTTYDKESSMVPVEAYHDTSAKTLLNGVVLPAGQDARQDLDDALDNIFAHQNVGPFIAHALIQRLVTSNPTPAYIGRVAAVFADNGSGTRGDLAAVTRAILLDEEARNGHINMPDTFGKVKEPVIRYTQVWRAFDATPGPLSDGQYRSPQKALTQISDYTGQSVLGAPSVFNFYLPDHRVEPGDELVAPELQIFSDVNAASVNNDLFTQIYANNNRRFTPNGTEVRIQIDREVALASDAGALLDHLDVLLCAGQLPPAQRAAIASHLATLPSNEEGTEQRALDAIYCIVGSPANIVQK